jgi:hypothetical protein
MRLVLNEDGDFSEPGIQTIAQGEVDDAVLASERDSRLGALFGERKEPLTLAAGENHREDIFHAANSNRTGIK